MENLGLYICLGLFTIWMITYWVASYETPKTSLNAGWECDGSGTSNLGTTWHPRRFYCRAIGDGPDGRWSSHDTLICTNKFTVTPGFYYIAHDWSLNTTRIIECTGINKHGVPEYNYQLTPRYIIKGQVIGVRAHGQNIFYNDQK